jgi:hypothetical protein
VADLASSPAVRIEASTDREDSSSRERSTAASAKIAKTEIRASAPELPDLDLGKEEQHTLDERA